MGSIRRSIGLLVASATVAGSLSLASPAAAAEPTRVRDTSTSVQAAAADGDRRIEISVERSENAGTYASARLYGGPVGDVLGGGEGTSEWTDATFHSEVQLFDEDQRPLGTVSLAGTYAIAGPGQRQEEKLNDGNIHVVIDRTRTPVSVSNVTVSLDGHAWQLEETEGSHTTEYLFISNPATYVGSGERVVVDGWSGSNVIDFHNDSEHSTLNETRFYFEYADSPHHAGGAIDLSKRTWQGTFDLFDKNGPVGLMPATATVTAGDPIRILDRVRGGYERWTFTPYDLELTVDGPLAPAKVTARLVRVQVAWHTSPHAGPEG
jgi:hypothetical protein